MGSAVGAGVACFSVAVPFASNSDLATELASFGVPLGEFILGGAVVGGLSFEVLLGVGAGVALVADAGTGVLDLLTTAAATFLSSFDEFEPVRDREGVLSAGDSLVGVGWGVTGALAEDGVCPAAPTMTGFSGSILRSARSLL